MVQDRAVVTMEG